MTLDKSPYKVYIRNDWHPQRALNSEGNLVDCSMRGSRPEEEWFVEYDSHKKVAFKNRKTGKYLAGRTQVNAKSETPQWWGIMISKHAPSPG